MKKLTLVLAVLLLALPSFAGESDTGESDPDRTPRAVEVDIRGGLAGFDRASYATVRAIFGSLVIDGTVEHFITTARGLEGGGTFCAELSPLAIPRLSSVAAQFRAISVDSISTVFSVRELESCHKPQIVAQSSQRTPK